MGACCISRLNKSRSQNWNDKRIQLRQPTKDAPLSYEKVIPRNQYFHVYRLPIFTYNNYYIKHFTNR